MISLLLRFYDVQKGAVRIDGIDVKDMDLVDLRSRFGVVLQDPFLSRAPSVAISAWAPSAFGMNKSNKLRKT